MTALGRKPLATANCSSAAAEVTTGASAATSDAKAPLSMWPARIEPKIFASDVAGGSWQEKQANWRWKRPSTTKEPAVGFMHAAMSQFLTRRGESFSRSYQSW